MSIVKSLSVGDGDMFYIQHGNDNFSIIDCCAADNEREEIVNELLSMARGKGVTRFISTHPDDDHIRGLAYLDDRMKLLNFYCVQNAATKTDWTEDFERYEELRDSSKAFYLSKGCSRRWMNEKSEERGSAGINVLWPVVDNPDFIKALQDAAEDIDCNNISPILTYTLDGGVRMIWMGDLKTEFVEAIANELELPDVDVLFAPHHGRESGKVPTDLLEALDPQVVVIGEAPSEYLDYYDGYNKITQNSAGDIMFDCKAGQVDIYCSNAEYEVDFLSYVAHPTDLGHYLGSFATRSR